MFQNGDKVTYTGPNYNRESRAAVCVSDQYDIHGITFINIRFANEAKTKKRDAAKDGYDSIFHVANVENLIERVY